MRNIQLEFPCPDAKAEEQSNPAASKQQELELKMQGQAGRTKGIVPVREVSGRSDAGKSVWSADSESGRSPGGRRLTFGPFASSSFLPETEGGESWLLKSLIG